MRAVMWSRRTPQHENTSPGPCLRQERWVDFMKRFQGVDCHHSEHLLNDEERNARDTVRR